MHEMNRWTVLTVMVVLSFVVTIVNTVYFGLSIPSVIGFVLAVVFTYWILVGCARRGEPLAKWLVHRLPVNTTTR